MKRLFPNTSVAGDPERARLLIQQLWSAVELLENREVSRRELSRYLGLSESSLGDWLQGDTVLHQVEALLRLLERVPGRWRREVFRAFLREHPTLYAPELSHEPATPERLRALLKKPRGLTLVVGATVSERTWLLTALGHAYAASGPVVGWAAQPADWLVPVPGVRYDGDQMFAVNDVPRADSIPARDVRALQLSNGLWRRFPEHRAQLSSAARTRHVIVADALVFEPCAAERMFAELVGTIDWLELNVPRPGLIHIEFGAA
jgi:hypothetical protein